MRAEEQRRASELDRLLRCSRIKMLGMKGWSIYIWNLLSRGISATLLRKSGLSANILEILAPCGSLTRTLSRTAAPNIRSAFQVLLPSDLYNSFICLFVFLESKLTPACQRKVLKFQKSIKKKGSHPNPTPLRQQCFDGHSSRPPLLDYRWVWLYPDGIILLGWAVGRNRCNIEVRNWREFNKGTIYISLSSG